MKIALYHLCLPGGALRMLREMASRSRHDIETFTIQIGDTRPGDDHVYPARCGGRAGAASGLAALAEVLTIERRVAHDIERGDFEAVLVHPSAVTQAPTITRYLKKPSVMFVQEPRRRSYERDYVNRRRGEGIVGHARDLVVGRYDRVVGVLDRRAVAAADLLVCNSWFSAEAIYRAYGRSARRCPPGVDSEVFRPVGVATSNRVVSVGGLEAFKGHAEIVDALALIPLARRPVLDLVFERCDSRYRVALAERASELGVKVEYHHGVGDDELVSLYGMAAATVCAAHLEPFGLTTLESLSCGTPVVAVCEGGFREVVLNQEDGILVERLPSALATAIEAACDGKIPGSPASRHGRVRQEWTWARSTQLLDDLLEEAAKAQRVS